MAIAFLCSAGDSAQRQDVETPRRRFGDKFNDSEKTPIGLTSG